MTALADIHVNPDGSGTVHLDGQTYPLAEPDMAAARRAGVGLIVDHAQHTGQPVRVTARDPHAEHHLLVSADGDVLPASAPGPSLDLEQPGATTPSRRPQLLGAALLLGAAAAGLAIPVLRPDQPAPTVQAPASAAPAEPVTPLILAGGLAVTAPATSTQPARIPGTRATARWAQAASWQARDDAKAAAKRIAARQRRHAGPATPSQPQTQAPAAPEPPAAAAPQQPYTPPNPTQPDVRIYPDPDINPN